MGSVSCTSSGGGSGAGGGGGGGPGNKCMCVKDVSSSHEWEGEEADDEGFCVDSSMPCKLLKECERNEECYLGSVCVKGCCGGGVCVGADTCVNGGGGKMLFGMAEKGGESTLGRKSDTHPDGPHGTW